MAPASFFVRELVPKRRHPYGGLVGTGGVGKRAWKFAADLSRIHSFHAVVDAIAHNHIKTPWLTKERLVAGEAAAVAVASGVVLGIRLRFHHHTPQQAAVVLAFHQPAANQLRGDHLSGAAEDGWWEDWEERAGDGRGGYNGGLEAERSKQLNKYYR